MTYLSVDTAWQLEKDRRTRLRDEFSRLRRLRPARPWTTSLDPPPRAGCRRLPS